MTRAKVLHPVFHECMQKATESRRRYETLKKTKVQKTFASRVSRRMHSGIFLSARDRRALRSLRCAARVADHRSLTSSDWKGESGRNFFSSGSSGTGCEAMSSGGEEADELLDEAAVVVVDVDVAGLFFSRNKCRCLTLYSSVL